jgi:hypothetical protein
VCQKQLETVVPRPGELVLVLRGAQKMQRARLLQKDNKVTHDCERGAVMMMRMLVLVLMLMLMLISAPISLTRLRPARALFK